MSAGSPADPLVTVVMIFLNGERFFDAAIQSVLNQTFVDWELILVDDGSTDRSTTIARTYAASAPEKIHYVEHSGHANRGMSASRNAGIRASRGQYIAFLDCDDVWHPEKLARQVSRLEQHPEVDLVYNATWRWYSWTGVAADRRLDHPRPLGVAPEQIVLPPQLVLRFLRNEGQTPATCSVLLRRAAIESVGGFEEEFRGLYEDQAFFYKVFLNSSGYVMDGHWDFYRQHPHSCCHVASKGADLTTEHPAHGRFLAWYRTFINGHPAATPELLAALAEARRPFDHPWRYRMERLARSSRRLAFELFSGDRQRSRRALKDMSAHLVVFRRRVVRRLLPVGLHQRLLAARDAAFR